MGCQAQNFDSLGAPFAAGVLLGGDEHLLPHLYAVYPARMLLAGGYLLSKYDVCVRYLNPAKHVIAPLDIDPTGPGLF